MILFHFLWISFKNFLPSIAHNYAISRLSQRVVFFSPGNFKIPLKKKDKKNTVVIYNNNFTTSWRLFAGKSETISNNIFILKIKIPDLNKKYRHEVIQQ